MRVQQAFLGIVLVLSEGCGQHSANLRMDVGLSESVGTLVARYDANPTPALRHQILENPQAATNSLCRVLRYATRGYYDRFPFLNNTFMKPIPPDIVKYMKDNKVVSVRALNAVLRERIAIRETILHALESGRSVPSVEDPEIVYHCMDAIEEVGDETSMKLVATIGYIRNDRQFRVAVMKCIHSLRHSKWEGFEEWWEKEGRDMFSTEEFKRLDWLRGEWLPKQSKLLKARGVGTNASAWGHPPAPIRSEVKTASEGTPDSPAGK